MRYVIVQIAAGGGSKQLPICYSASLPDEAAKTMVEAVLAQSEGSRLVAAGNVAFFEKAVSCDGYSHVFEIGSRGRHDEILIQSADHL